VKALLAGGPMDLDGIPNKSIITSVSGANITGTAGLARRPTYAASTATSG
jgi:S1-C subfamily serine protease